MDRASLSASERAGLFPSVESISVRFGIRPLEPSGFRHVSWRASRRSGGTAIPTPLDVDARTGLFVIPVKTGIRKVHAEHRAG